MKGESDACHHQFKFMITNGNKKVICIKDIPSNIIEEAIFILKTDEKNNEKARRKEFAMREAECFVTDYSKQLESEDDELDAKYSDDDYKVNNMSIKLKVALILTAVISIGIIVCGLIKYIK